MKTLEMLIKAEKDGRLYKSGELYYSKKDGFTDSEGKNWAGRGFETLNSLIHDEGVYSGAWKEVVQLSDDENAILRNLSGKWITRNESGSLFCHSIKPHRISKYWHNPHSTQLSLEAFNHLFKMVQWEDEKPTLIADLLKG